MNTIMTNVAYDPVLFGVSGNEAEKSKRVAQEVESLFLYQLMKEMDATVERDEEGLIYSDYEDTYRSLFHQELARELARSGGIGLQEMVERDIQLKNQNQYTNITGEKQSTHTFVR